MQGRTRRGGGPKLTTTQKKNILNKSKKAKNLNITIKKANKKSNGGGSPNQKFKEEVKKKKENIVKLRDINPPGTDPVKIPTGVNRPNTSASKKDILKYKIKKLNDNFVVKALRFGTPLPRLFFETNALYQQYLKLKDKYEIRKKA
mgnify:CR=1 FL=1